MTITVDELQRLVSLVDTKANIIAFAGTPTEVLGPVYATDTSEIGIYNGSWHWVGAAAALTVQDEGTPLATGATALNFVGAGVVASGTGATKTITIGGTSVTAAAVAALGFVGPILMTDGTSAPPIPLTTEDGTDYLYADL